MAFIEEEPYHCPDSSTYIVPDDGFAGGINILFKLVIEIIEVI